MKRLRLLKIHVVRYTLFFILQTEYKTATMTVKMPNQLFINGEFVEAQTGKTFDTINPADETVSTIRALTALKMKFSIKDFFSKCDQIRRKLQIWSDLLSKFLMENLSFCAVAKSLHFPGWNWVDSSKDVREVSWMSHGVMRFWSLLSFLFISAFFDILATLSITLAFSSGISGRWKSSCSDIPRTIIKFDYIN